MFAEIVFLRLLQYKTLSSSDMYTQCPKASDSETVEVMEFTSVRDLRNLSMNKLYQ
jgi:hypothetical protein